MRIDGDKLREARKQLGLSQTETAEFLNVSLVTYQRWEQGKAQPQPFHLRQIQIKFQPTFQLLGIEFPESATLLLQQGNETASVTSSIPIATFPSEDESTTEMNELHTPMTLHLLSLAYNNHSTDDDKPRMVRQALKEFDRMNINNKSYQITRREAISTLAALPIATLGLSIPGSTVQPAQYGMALAHCTASLEACWELYRSSDAINTHRTFKNVSTYVPLLETIAENASQYRKEALTLATRYAILKTLLGWICLGPTQTLQYAKEAVVLSKAAGDIALQLSAYSKLSWAYFYLKEYRQAMKAAQEAEAQLQQYLQIKHAQPLHPSVYGGIYSTLALMQARNGEPPDIAMGKTSEVDPVEHYAFMTTTRSTLLLEAGWTYYYQGNQTKAMETLEKRIDPETFTARIQQSERGRIETINVMALSSLKTKDRDLEKTIHFWVAGMEGAKSLKDEQRFNEALTAYELMEVIWPGEQRIVELQDHIVHW